MLSVPTTTKPRNPHSPRTDYAASTAIPPSIANHAYTQSLALSEIHTTARRYWDSSSGSTTPTPSPRNSNSRRRTSVSGKATYTTTPRTPDASPLPSPTQKNNRPTRSSSTGSHPGHTSINFLVPPPPQPAPKKSVSSPLLLLPHRCRDIYPHNNHHHRSFANHMATSDSDDEGGMIYASKWNPNPTSTPGPSSKPKHPSLRTRLFGGGGGGGHEGKGGKGATWKGEPKSISTTPGR